MTAKLCPFCAEDIQAAAIFCRHCRKLVVKPEIVDLGRKWGGLSPEGRTTRWDQLSDVDQQHLRATIEYMASEEAAPSASTGRRKMSPIAWGFLILLGLLVLGVVFSSTNNSLGQFSRPRAAETGAVGTSSLFKGDVKRAAWNYCQQSIKAQLREHSASNAYPSDLDYEIETTQLGADRFRIDSSFRAYGKEARYGCVVEQHADSSFRLVDFEFDLEQ